jgi:hypothetical protein
VLADILAANNRHFIGSPAHPEVVRSANGLGIGSGDGESFEIQSIIYTHINISSILFLYNNQVRCVGLGSARGMTDII